MNSQILINSGVLSLSYLPEKLLHREKERFQLLSNIRNSINTFICGNNGSGKTTLVKHAIQKPQQERLGILR
jgi:Cdc6-like AAA superfamily ATPase